MTKRVLLLGSGFVAQPVIDTLAATEGIEVTVACRTLANAKQLASASGSDAISLDVTDDSALDAALGQHDLVISLIIRKTLNHVPSYNKSQIFLSQQNTTNKINCF